MKRFGILLLIIGCWSVHVQCFDLPSQDGTGQGYHAHSFPYHNHGDDESDEATIYPEPSSSSRSKGDDGTTTPWPKVSESPAFQGRSIFATLATYLPMLLSSRDEHASQTPINVTDLLRMVGIDSNKIGTMVINAVVYLIEMVSNHFFGGSNSIESRNIDSPGSLLLYLFDTRRAENFMKTITNPNYPGNIIANLKRQTGNDTVCIQQLICKMSPFWWGVNRSVRDLLPVALGKSGSKMPSLSFKSLLMKYVPSMKEFTANSDDCDVKYPGCIVMALGKHSNSSSSQHDQH
ncbi:hypothetical protein CHUAL_009119 [Chamberlinius hualienensis]